MPISGEQNFVLPDPIDPGFDGSGLYGYPSPPLQVVSCDVVPLKPKEELCKDSKWSHCDFCIEYTLVTMIPLYESQYSRKVKEVPIRRGTVEMVPYDDYIIDPGFGGGGGGTFDCNFTPLLLEEELCQKPEWQHCPFCGAPSYSGRSGPPPRCPPGSLCGGLGK